MKYSEIRQKLKTGDVLLFNGKGFVSWLIKRATLSNISHVGMVYAIGGEVFCWESTSLRKGKCGVQISLLSNRLQEYNGKVWVRRLEANRDGDFYSALRDFRQEVKGREYEQNLWELAGAAMPWFNKTDLTTVFCSELIAEAYKRMRLITCDTPSNEFTPADFTARRGRVDRYIRPSEASLGSEILLEI